MLRKERNAFNFDYATVRRRYLVKCAIINAHLYIGLCSILGRWFSNAISLRRWLRSWVCRLSRGALMCLPVPAGTVSMGPVKEFAYVYAGMCGALVKILAVGYFGVQLVYTIVCIAIGVSSCFSVPDRNT